MKIRLMILILLVNTSLFAQVKFTAGVSLNPNLSFDKFGYQSKPGFDMGAGVNAGVYLGRRFLILTGIERMREKYLTNANSSIYTSSWDIPLLINYLLSEDGKRISLFFTAGAVGGKYDLSEERNLFGVKYNPYYLSPAVGLSCKINLIQKLSLFFSLTDLNQKDINSISLRSMLMYTF